jgi:hypothetical protein
VCCLINYVYLYNVVSLTVPPSIYPPEDEIHVLNATQTVSLGCFASGYPRPQIHWQKDGKDVSNHTHMRYVLCVKSQRNILYMMV